MVTVHILNDGVHTVDELIIQIMERIFNEIRSENGQGQYLDYFKDHIESVGIGDLTSQISKPSKEELKSIKDNFAFNLSDLVRNFKDKDGLFIVIDDINGLSETPILQIGIKVLPILFQHLLIKKHILV